MSSQIAPTPTIRGPEAEKIYAEANRKSSTGSKKGAGKLASIFDQMMRDAGLDRPEQVVFRIYVWYSKIVSYIQKTTKRDVQVFIWDTKIT